MPASCLADVLATRVDLSDAEHTALARLEERPREVRRGAVLQRENERGSDLYVVSRGVLMSYVLLDDGSRQILRFHFRGDMIGMAGVIYGRSPETIAALSDAEVCAFDRAALARIFEEHPRIAALILVLNQVERVALTDRLAALGRTSAKARVAALLLDMRNRLRAGDKTVIDTYTLGLTQEEIGDATGLTSVHVNRMLRQLEEDGLIAREAGRVTIRDERALARAANYVDRFEGLELGWLPARR